MHLMARHFSLLRDMLIGATMDIYDAIFFIENLEGLIIIYQGVCKILARSFVINLKGHHRIFESCNVIRYMSYLFLLYLYIPLWASISKVYIPPWHLEN